MVVTEVCFLRGSTFFGGALTCCSRNYSVCGGLTFPALAGYIYSGGVNLKRYDARLVKTFHQFLRTLSNICEDIREDSAQNIIHGV